MLKPATVAQTLLRALDRWKSLWSRAIERVAPDKRQWLGVARHAPETAWLSRRIIEVSMAAQNKEVGYLRRVTTYDLKDFHEFIREYGATSEISTRRESRQTVGDNSRL